jgi:NADH-quinone oxidoreductase subunit F
MSGEIILKNTEKGKTLSLNEYIEKGGYGALEKALKELTPQDVIKEVKNSGLRGRGGAGFPTGLKWDFVPKEKMKKYLVVNADEGEPGTFKDREIMERNPHLLLEGTAIASYAIGADEAFIYLRWEYPHILDILKKAIEEAGKEGFIGNKIMGTDFSLKIHIFRGAGAYICGEETALIESIEGKRGFPRKRPPFPVTYGILGRPTVVNNVETLSNIPFIITNGAKEFRKFGTEESPGTKLFSVSGSVKKPGVYEFPLGSLTMRELIFDHCGGLKEGTSLLGVIPGGISTPILLPDELDVKLDYESLREVGSMLGSGGVIVLDDSIPIFKIAERIIRFFFHESCGKCTPCREGNYWMYKILRNSKKELRLLKEIASNIQGKCFCPLGDSSALTIKTLVEKYSDFL